MTFAPSDLSGLRLWLRAKDLGSGGSNVTTWPDQSGRANDATAPSTAPTVAASSTPGGGKSVSFGGRALNLARSVAGSIASATASSEPAGSSFGAAKAIDGDRTGTRLLLPDSTGGSPQWLRLNMAAATVVTYYKIWGHSSDTQYNPTDWKFQGTNDGTFATWTDLDTRSGITWSSPSDTKAFTFSNSTAYSWYRLLITGNVSATDFTAISEIILTPDATQAELWVVVKATSQTANTQPWQLGAGASSQVTLYPWSNAQIVDNFGVTTHSDLWTPTLDVSQWRLYRVRVDTGQLDAWLDNSLQKTKTGLTMGWAGAPVISNNFSGNIAEFVVVVGSVLTSGEVADMITYFNTEHGLSVSGGSTTVTGAVAATAPAPTASVVGVITRTGAVDATPASPTLTVPGNVSGVTSGTVDATATPPTVAVAGTVTAPITGAVAATPTHPNLSVTDATNGAAVSVGATIEVGALTLLTIVTLPGVQVSVGLGAITVGDSQPVEPLPGVNVGVGASLTTQTAETVTVDPRRAGPQWRYVVTDLANTPLGELTELTHEPVADGVNTPTTMKFIMAADAAERALIESADAMTRKCQVWEGDRLLLWGPLLPDQQTDATAAGYTVHDPSWWWRGGRRVIGRLPRLNLLHNGDFKQGLTYWTRGYDADSIPKAAPKVTIVTEDFLEDTDGLDPIRAAEITGVESVTESELSSNAVFWPNLATFRPGGVAAIEAVANAMPTTAGLKVTVIGHTANDGTGNGLGLSLRRANAAAAIIHTKRPAAVITTKGVGFYDPKPGFPIDSQAQRRVVIQYDQTITGKSKQWMRQTIEVSQPKTARYPLILTLAAMLKVADDWSVPDANMTSLKLVVRRQGAAKPIPWDSVLGTGESSISDTDPVDRWIPQTAQATVPADGRTYLVDVYLYAPAALARYTAVGLFPEEQLYFWGVDQALIFKGIVEHIQSTALGHGDLGIETRTPLTGILRDRTYSYRDHMAADTALEEFGGLNRGMDYDTLMYADGRVVLSTYYPQQGKQVGYTLVLGGNVAAATPEQSRDVASSIIMQAQDLGSYRAEAYAKDTRALGGLLLERVVTAEQETPLNELREAARQELAWGSTSTTGYWLDIDPDSIAEVLANTSKGDVVRLILDTPVAVDRLARIVNRERHPDSLRLLVALEA